MGRMLGVLAARRQSVRAFYRHRAQQLHPQGQQQQAGPDEVAARRAAELARLRAYFKEIFLEVALVHKTEGRALASAVLALDGRGGIRDDEMDDVFALFEEDTTILLD